MLLPSVPASADAAGATENGLGYIAVQIDILTLAGEALRAAAGKSFFAGEAVGQGITLN